MSWRRFLSILTTTGLFALYSSTALAWDPSQDCPPLPKVSVKAQMLAGELFGQAEQSYRDGDPETSLKQFLCSFQIVQHENTVFNIAQIAKLSQGREIYLGLLEDFVAGVRGTVKVDPIREIIDELEGRTISESQDAEPTAMAMNEKGNDLSESEVPESVPVDGSNGPAPKKRGLKIAGWALLGVGIAGLGAGAALQAMAGGAASDAEAAETLPEFNSAESKMNGLQIGAIAGFAAGGAAAIAGMVCVLVSKKGDERAAAVSVTPAVGGFAISGRF